MLSMETASLIVQAVFSDAKCRNLITVWAEQDLNAGAMTLLSIFHQAGWVKDAWLLWKGLSKDDLDKLNCIGVTSSTVNAINKKKATIPGLAAVSTSIAAPVAGIVRRLGFGCATMPFMCSIGTRHWTA